MTKYVDKDGLNRFFDNIKDLSRGPSYQQVKNYLDSNPESLDQPVSDYFDDHPTATIANNSVTTAKIANSAVTTEKINSAAVTTAKIADNAIVTNKIADDAITANKLANNAVNGLPIMSTTQIGVAKVGAGLAINSTNNSLELDGNGDISTAVTSWLDAHPEATTTVEDGSITGDKIADNTITDAKLVQTGGILETLNNFTDEHFSKNIFNENIVEWVYGNVTSSGAVTETPTVLTRKRTDYLEFVNRTENDTEVCFIIDAENISNAYLNLFDSDKTFISRTQVAINGTQSYSIIGATYYILLVNSSTDEFDINSVMISYGSNVSAYVPYERILKVKNGHLPEEYDNYVSKFINKADTITWTVGYRVRNTQPNALDVNTHYSIAHISVKKGDLIIMDYGQNILPDVTAAIARDVTYDGGAVYRSVVSGGNSIIRWIAPNDMNLVLSIRHDYYPTIYWYEIPVYAEAIDSSVRFVRFLKREVVPLLVASSRAPMYHANPVQKPLVLLHFSDIHNDVTCTENIKEFITDYEEYLDDCILTGDMTGSYANYNPIFNESGYEHILLSIGNHDVYDADGDATDHGVGYDDVAYWATNVEKYNQYFAPNITNWNVVQPAGAQSNGLCYYYKDYSITNGSTIATVDTIRLIVLDAMAYDAAQHSWLTSVLLDAQEDGIPVLIAEHFPPIINANTINTFDTSFTSIMRGMERQYGLSNLGYNGGTITAMDAVDDFINNGGEFICWLCGHLHYGMVGTTEEHPNQIFIAIEMASTNSIWSDVPRENNTKTEDLFNIVSIDTYNKTIRVARIGAEYDDHLRHRGTMCLDYANKTLISSN